MYEYAFFQKQAGRKKAKHIYKDTKLAKTATGTVVIEAESLKFKIKIQFKRRQFKI